MPSSSNGGFTSENLADIGRAIYRPTEQDIPDPRAPLYIVYCPSGSDEFSRFVRTNCLNRDIVKLVRGLGNLAGLKFHPGSLVYVTANTEEGELKWLRDQAPKLGFELVEGLAIERPREQPNIGTSGFGRFADARRQQPVWVQPTTATTRDTRVAPGDMRSVGSSGAVYARDVDVPQDGLRAMMQPDGHIVYDGATRDEALPTAQWEVEPRGIPVGYMQRAEGVVAEIERERQRMYEMEIMRQNAIANSMYPPLVRLDSDESEMPF